MKLTVIRTDLLPDRTLGLLDIDGVFFCYTLEDTDRQLEVDIMRKQYGETAIPRGTYPMVLDFSARFKRVLPHVLGVAGFDGIRIHAGNTPVDTHGCVLVGDTRLPGNTLGNSRPAMDRLMKRLSLADGDKLTLVVA